MLAEVLGFCVTSGAIIDKKLSTKFLKLIRQQQQHPESVKLQLAICEGIYTKKSVVR